MGLKRRIRVGMVGGGPGGFIGQVHRMAVALDNRAELVAGAFSSQRKKSEKIGQKLFLSPDRIYGSYQEMAEKESLREDKIDLLTIAAPNHLHYPVARTFLNHGINVICEKPMAVNLNQARKLVDLVEKTGLLFAMTYNYTGYPLVKEAKSLIESGKLGEIRVIMAEYPQDGLGILEERESVWRLDRDSSGGSFAVGDIGTHVENLVAYVTGLKINRLMANLSDFTGCGLDDDAQIMVEYNNRARGVYWASKVAVGHENSLKIRIYGSKAALKWEQERPNILKLQYKNKPVRYLTRGQNNLSKSALRAARLPVGHPEGYIEAFANIFKNVFDLLENRLSNSELKPEFGEIDYPDVHAGFQGVKFFQKCIESSLLDSKWIGF